MTQPKEVYFVETYIVNTDASSRYGSSTKARKRNLHPSSIGVVIKKGNDVVGTLSKRVGMQDSNYAEFLAMHAACKFLLEQGVKKVHFNVDCINLSIMANQHLVSNKPRLRSISNAILHMLGEFDKYTITYVPRRENAEAHKMARLAFKVV